MRTLQRLLLLILIISGYSFLQADAQTTFEAKASAKVKEFVAKHNLEIVDFDYVNQAVGKGLRKSATAVILDARPMKKYQISHIPSALALPDTKFDAMYASVMKGIAKDKEIIAYCGGFKCVKSPKLAVMLKDKGYKNVKVYAAGMPDWSKKHYVEMDISVAKKMFDKQSALFIDARPNMKFKKGTIKAAISIPDRKFEQYKNQLPTDMKQPLIVFCGGYACHKSHVVAQKLRDLGYQRVFVYAGGAPEWKKAKYPMVKGEATKKATVSKTKSTGILKAGADTGSVDGDWFVANYKKLSNTIAIVNVMSKEEFEANHIPGSINVHAEKLTPQQLLDALPKNKEIIFYCGTGTRAMEAWGMLAEELKYKGISRVKYLDANIECKNNQCQFEVNEPLGI